MCICYLEGVWGCLVEPGTLCPLIAGVVANLSSFFNICHGLTNSKNKTALYIFWGNLHETWESSSHQGISNIKPRTFTLYSVFRSCYGKAYTKPDWRGPASQYSGCSSCFTSSRRISDSGQVFSVSPWRIARLVLPNFIPPRRGPEPAPRHRSRSRDQVASDTRHLVRGPGAGHST